MNFKLEREYIQNIEKYYNNNQIDRAIEYCEEILKELPDSFNIKFFYAKMLKEVGKFDEASIQFSNLELKYPENINLLLELGELNFFLKKYELSKEYLEKVLFYDHFNQKAKVLLDKIDEFNKEVEVDNNENAENVSEYEIRVDDSESIDDLSKDLNIEEDSKEVDNITNNESNFENISHEDDVINTDNVKDVKEEKLEENVFNELNSIISDKMHNDLKNEVEEERSFIKTVEKDLEEDIDFKKEDDENIDKEFQTESAAELYLKQELYDSALKIYEKLYEDSKDKKYLELIEKTKKIKYNKMLIKNLEKFLEVIKKRGISV